MNNDLWEERRRTAKADSPIEQQLRTIIHNTMGKRGYYSRPLENDLADALETLFDTYAARRAGLGASEKPQPQEEVGGKQVVTFSDNLRALSSAIYGTADEENASGIMELVHSYVDKAMDLAREDERKLVQDAADHNAYERFKGEIERLSHPHIQVLRKQGEVMFVEMLLDVTFGGNEIQVVIAGTDLTTDSPDTNNQASQSRKDGPRKGIDHDNA